MKQSAGSATVISELRCPNGPSRLLAKVRSEGDPVTYTPSNLMELACRDCSRTARENGEEGARVLHRFDLLGVLVESVIELPGGATRIIPG